MFEYKVELLARAATRGRTEKHIQELLDRYAADGWHLAPASISFGLGAREALLIFERARNGK